MTTPIDFNLPARNAFGYRNAGLVSALLVIACFFMLFSLRNLPPGYGTYVIGAASILVLGFALWVKYRGQWRMNAELILLFGAALQYLIAPTLLQLMTGGFRYLPDEI